MGQPIRKHKTVLKVPKTITGSGEGLDYCNECPFLNLSSRPFCNINDKFLPYSDIERIPVPRYCGNCKEKSGD